MQRGQAEEKWNEWEGNLKKMKRKRYQIERESVSQRGGGKGEECMNECTDRMRTNAESEREETKVDETAFIRF